MKKAALIVDYILFIILFAVMFLQTSESLQTVKYLLLLLGAYFLFKTTMRSKKNTTTHVYNYLFMAASIIYVLYVAWYKGALFPNITLYFFVAAIIGLALAITYKETKRKPLPPPPKPVIIEKKTVAKKTAKKKVAKKITKKKTTTKTAKKVAKKKVAKKTTTKKVTKKATKKTAKKATTKSSRSKAMDAKLISVEEHEMKTVLRRYKKRGTKENIKFLQGLTKTFKADPKNAPRNRENFYKFLDKNKRFAKLK